jgi:hypothetical protein
MVEQGISASSQRGTSPVHTADGNSGGVPPCTRDRRRAAGNLSQTTGERSKKTGCLRDRRDLSWILADDLLDLRAYVPEQEIQAHLPELIANDTVNGRLVALPANLNEGMLFYRVDLLRKYGYRGPPKTWEELEVMARRIQAGERANGNKDFWGFVWEGTPYEGLTCSALEWQVSEAGGQLLASRAGVRDAVGR